MTFDDLLYRLYDRYSVDLDADVRRNVENQIEQDAVVVLISLIGGGIERGDLRDDEVEAALELARNNRLLRSSEYLAEELSKIKEQRAAA